MTLTAGEVVVLDDILIDFSVEEILSTPPFPRWTSSVTSGTELVEAVERLHEPVESALDNRGLYCLSRTAESGIEPYNPPAGLVAGEYVLPGVLTIGEGLEQTEPTDGLLDGLVIDAMENVALQLVRTEVLTGIRDAARDQNLNTTQVYVPGVRADGWDMERRQFMFEALPTERIGAYLRGSGVTDPPKTFAFAMGLGADIQQSDFLLSCANCGLLADCPYVGSVVA
ncbi:MAG: hypothetical protein ABEJ92_08115 [Halobacteriales archaeon]